MLVTNNTGVEATLFGWVDYNGDGIFDNATERASVTVPTGTTGGMVNLVFSVKIPEDSAASTIARFRLSTDGAASDPTGAASDGEVEDYPVTMVTSTLVDYGDAPDSAAGIGVGNYQTTVADGGPSHTIVADLQMGADVDGESDSAQPSLICLLYTSPSPRDRG